MSPEAWTLEEVARDPATPWLVRHAAACLREYAAGDRDPVDRVAVLEVFAGAVALAVVDARIRLAKVEREWREREEAQG